MSDHTHQQHTDAEESQRQQETIDTAQGPGPVLDQDRPQAMPLFEEGSRPTHDVNSVIDPQEFAELGQRSGEELDHVRAISEGDELGVAGRAAQVRPDTDDPQA